jgi:hypothetical protein
MVADLKQLLVWFTEIALDPLAAIGATLLAAAAPFVIVSRQVVTDAEHGNGPRPNLRIVKARSSPPAPSVPVINTAQPAPAGQHWQRLTDAIASNIAAARGTADLQAAARMKLDAADFALSQIFQDLADVMPGLDRQPAAAPMAGRRLAA